MNVNTRSRSAAAAAAVVSAAPKTKKRFRPIRSSVRTIVGRVGDDRAICRTHALNVQEDLAIQVLNKIAHRSGVFVKRSGRRKIVAKDVEAAVKFEFGEGFATRALEFANTVLDRKRSNV